MEKERGIDIYGYAKPKFRQEKNSAVLKWNDEGAKCVRRDLGKSNINRRRS